MGHHLAKIIVRLTTFGLLCLLSLGCVQQESSDHKQHSQFSTRSIKIGLSPEYNLFEQKKRFEPLLTQLSQNLGVSIEVSLLPGYGNIIDSINEFSLDGFFFGNFTGTMAVRQLGMEPLVKPQFANGLSTSTSLVFVKKGSGIRTAQDMRDKRMVFVDQATTTGYLLPLSFFKSLGIDNYQSWFKEYYFSGTHEDAIKEVLNGNADIGAAKDTIFHQLAETDKRVLTDLDILATSPPVPANTFAVRHDLPDDLKQALRQELLTMHQSATGRAILDKLKIAKFIETTENDFQPVFDYAAGITPGMTPNDLND
jgi:phosphonate transport system substrate-binding protein